MARYRIWNPRRRMWVYITEDQLGNFPNAPIYRRDENGNRVDVGTPAELGFTGTRAITEDNETEEAEFSYEQELRDIIAGERNSQRRETLQRDIDIVLGANQDNFRSDDVRRSRARLNQYLDYELSGGRGRYGEMWNARMQGPANYSTTYDSEELYPGSQYGLRPLAPTITQQNKRFANEGNDLYGSVIGDDNYAEMIYGASRIDPLNNYIYGSIYNPGGEGSARTAIDFGYASVDDDASMEAWAREAARSEAESWRRYQDFYDIPYSQNDYNNRYAQAYNSTLRNFAIEKLRRNGAFPQTSNISEYFAGKNGDFDGYYNDFAAAVDAETKRLRSYNATESPDPFSPPAEIARALPRTGRVRRNGVSVNVGGTIASENNKGYEEMIRYIAERGGTTPEKLRPVMDNMMNTILNEESGGTHNDWVLDRSTTADGYYQNVLGTANEIRAKIQNLARQGYDFSDYLDAATVPFSRVNRFSRLSPENQLTGATGVFAYWDDAAKALGRIANSYDANNPMASEPALNKVFVKYYGGAGNNAKLARHFGNRFNAYYSYLYGPDTTPRIEPSLNTKVPVNPLAPYRDEPYLEDEL